MSNGELDISKRRIIKRLNQLAVEFKVLIKNLEWGPPEFEVRPGPGIQQAGPTWHPLAFFAGGRRIVLRFSVEELLDSNASGKQGQEAWSLVDDRIQRLMKKFAPKAKRIGF